MDSDRSLRSDDLRPPALTATQHCSDIKRTPMGGVGAPMMRNASGGGRRSQSVLGVSGTSGRDGSTGTNDRGMSGRRDSEVELASDGTTNYLGESACIGRGADQPREDRSRTDQSRTALTDGDRT